MTEQRCEKCKTGQAVKKLGRPCYIFLNHKDEKDWRCPYFEEGKEGKEDG